MIKLESHSEGVIVPVRAQAAARRNDVKGLHAGALQIMVTQAPEKGKANKAIAEVLAKFLHVKKSQVEILSGETQPQKRFLVRGVEIEELATKLRSSLKAAE